LVDIVTPRINSDADLQLTADEPRCRTIPKPRGHRDQNSHTRGFSQLTSDDKALIRSTWPLLSHDPYGIGARVFLRIFELAPDARRLFRFDELSEVELIVNGLFRIHAQRFIRAIDLAVNNLDAIDLVVVSNLVQLGRQHAMIAGFKVEYMDAFRMAMTDVWEAEIGRKRFVGDVQKAWSKLFRVISNSVLDGYRQRTSELVVSAMPRRVADPRKDRLDSVSDVRDGSYDFDD